MSILANLERAKENAAKFKKAECMHLYLSQRIGMQEKLLKDAERLAKEYAESAIRLRDSLERNKKEYERISGLLAENRDAISNADDAEKIAEKIAKLQKQIEELTKKLPSTT